MHLTEDMYLLLIRGVLEPSQLVEAAHEHAVESCDRCRQEWQRFVSEKTGDGLRVVAPRHDDHDFDDPAPRCDVTVPLLPDDDDALSVEDYERWKKLLSRMRHETRKAREDVGQLIELPPETWEERVERSKTRFRSRAFAQHLLTRYRQQVRDEPEVAARLAALVPVVLRCLPGVANARWAVALSVRSEAYRANAERVSGDLPAAARRFTALRSRLQHLPSVDEAALVEVDSLEASLCYSQRRFVEEEFLLARTEAGARRTGHRQELFRALIKRGRLEWTEGRPEEALTTLQDAERLCPDDRSYDLACLLANRSVALCELERYWEASRLLDRAEPLMKIQRNSAAYMLGIRGRVALGTGSWDKAAAYFRAARSSLLDLGRDYDAALVSVDLACTLAAIGDRGGVRRLTAALGPIFESLGVEREPLALMRLQGELRRVRRPAAG